MFDGQKERWIKLHKRKADLGWLLVQNFDPDKRDEGDLIKAEIAKVDAEIDALLLEMSDE